MVQVDLITGFLGAGKTTFLRRYAAWWAGQGVKVCVLENDFGAVNVDAMLLQDLEARGVELETISGGCDCDTHQRRMRTKLISMAMRGFERVIVEPSGTSRWTAGIGWAMSSPSWMPFCRKNFPRRQNISSLPRVHGRAVSS